MIVKHQGSVAAAGIVSRKVLSSIAAHCPIDLSSADGSTLSMQAQRAGARTAFRRMTARGAAATGVSLLSNSPQFSKISGV